MSLPIQSNQSLSQHTTLKVGGNAEYFVRVESEDQLCQAVSYAQNNAMPLTVLGGGSNVLISDQGIRGLVVHLSMQGITVETQDAHVRVTAAAGETLDEVVRYAVSYGYWGLENLSHIPGTVGAAPVQNVGAYGVEVQELIETVRVFNTDTGAFEVLTAEACTFAYRDSLFKQPAGKKYIVTAVTFLLTTEPTPRLSYKDLQNRFGATSPELTDIRQAVIEIRALKFPDWKTVGTAGSFFKNPVVSSASFKALCATYPELPGFPMDADTVKIPLGWILDKVLNLKGVGNDTVGTYQGQALVLINKGDATASDITAFADGIAQQVHKAVGIDIEWEVTKIGG